MADRLLHLFERALFGADNEARPELTPKRTSQEGADSIASRQPGDNRPQKTAGVSYKSGTVAASTINPGDNKEAAYLTRTFSWSTLQNSPTVSRLVGREDPSEPHPRWRPGFFQPRPLAGICGLLISICCILGSLAILVASDKQPVSSWKIQPTVYLAIVAAISNSALVHARRQAMPISWWFHASRSGSVRSLQRHYEVGQSLACAILNIRYPSLLHLACLATSIVIVDGALLQRASTIIPATTSHNVTLNLTLPRELPTGFSGYYLRHVFWAGQTCGHLVIDWMNDVPMHLRTPQCTGTCRVTVEGPGLAQRNCSSQTWPITGAMFSSYNATWGRWKGHATLPAPYGAIALLPAFYIGLSPPTYVYHGDYERVVLDIGLLSVFHLEGEYHETTCEYVAAIVEYDILLTNGLVTIADHADQGRVLRLANNTKPIIPDSTSDKKLPATLEELTSWLSSFVDTNASVALNAEQRGAVWSPLGSTYNSEALRHANYSNGGGDLNFYDPTPSVISKFNQLMFRGAIMAATQPQTAHLLDSDVSINQTVQGQESITQNVFSSDLRWYVGAAVLELVTVVFVLPMFWGWWTLGKNLTLSPFDVALAFDSPLLDDINSGASARGVVERIGSTRLKYGVVQESESPQDEADEGKQRAFASGRLGMAANEDVTRPRKGAQFRT